MQDKSSSGRGHLKNIHYLRGIAAASICFHHIWIALVHYQGFSSNFFDFLSDISRSSIELFFVLSGFIMVFTNSEKKGIKHIPSFIKKRIIRIYVPYIPLAIVLYATYSLLPELSNNTRSIDFITNFFLIPHGIPALSVAWTLVFEIIFYFTFIFWFLGKNWWKTFTLVWFFSIIIANTIEPELLINTHEWHLLSTYNLLFILGTWGGIYFDGRMLSAKGRIAFLILLIIGLIFAFSSNILLVKHLVLGLSFTLFLFYLGESNPVKMINLRFLGFLGTISYSLYLVHNPLIALFMRVNSNFPINQSHFLIPLILVLILIVAYIYYIIFEKKIMNYIRKKTLS